MEPIPGWEPLKVSVKEFLHWLKHSGSTRAAALSRVSLGERRGYLKCCFKGLGLVAEVKGVGYLK